MKRFFILTFCDLVRYGDGVKDVWMFDNEDEAIQKMNSMYFEKCKEEGISEDEMFDDKSYDFEFGTNYAYLSGRYYWDIFNKDLYQD